MKYLYTIVSLLLFYSAEAQDRIQKIDSLLNNLHQNNKLNGNVLIAEKGNIVYNKSFGLANESTGARLNDSSIFELASVSKQFTAMAIAILKEKNKLKYEDKISKYLPELSFYDKVTVADLVYHTSGLPDYMELMDSLYDKSKIATNKDIINFFAKYKPALLFSPNSKWEYSNTGYAFLASIIEKASGMSYGDYLQQSIFEPLSMKNTFVYRRRYAPRNINNYAFGYVYSESLKKYVLPDQLKETNMVIWLDGVVGDGTVNSTVTDLLKWDRALYTNRLLSAKGMRDLFLPDTLSDGSATEYGMGWMLSKEDDFGRMVSHSGGWPGYGTFIDRHIDHDKTIIILKNHSGGVNPARSIRNILYNKPLPTQKVRKEIKLPEATLRKYAGVYEIQQGLEMNVTADHEQLYVQLTGQSMFPLYAEDENNFFLKVVDAQLQFSKNEQGEYAKVTLFQNGNKIEAKKIK